MQPPQTQPQPPKGNMLLFVAVTFLLILIWMRVRDAIWPPPPSPDPVADTKKPDTPPTKPVFKLPTQPPPTPQAALLTLGKPGKDSPYNLFVRLDPRGGGVRSVTLNKFLESNDYGKPSTGPLNLVPGEANQDEPSHLLFHFAPGGDRPLDTLGKLAWKVTHQGDDTSEAGKPRQNVTFQASLDGFTISKAYSLAEGDYHIGLVVTVTRDKTAKGTSKFRYQLTGAKGLPVEGKWYTNTFRNCLIAIEDDNGYVIDRNIQDLEKVSWKGGGDAVEQTPAGFIRYAGVAVQYFASVIAVEGSRPRFLKSARPTLERGVIHGRATGPVFGDELKILSNDGKTTETVRIPDELAADFAAVTAGTRVAIVFRNLGYDPALSESPKLALELHTGLDADSTHAKWEDDVTVRVNTEPEDMKPGDSLTHRYTLYNGPVKPLLMNFLRGDAAVDPALVTHYSDELKLRTLIDYQSPGWWGSFWANIGWSWLVIWVTNLVHYLLNTMHSWVPNLGLCIILLTVLMRVIMFPLSKRQAMMGIKMQALAPDLKKLQEKYKDPDQRQELTLAQWELYKKHGVNPAGSCWIILLQMPIFLGLYYALQESITFRLGGFWPTWITNLSAPDMMFNWGRGIYMISRDADYGSFLYLGPYFNLLPILAIVFMMIQQQMMTPPAMDEQQEMQQKMMKWMMIFFGLMFYKVAAGLCVYYIITTVWGFAERRFLPKAELDKVKVDLQAAGAPITAAASASDRVAPAASVQGFKKKSKKKSGGEKPKDDAPPGWGQRWADWWNDILEKAKKK